MRSPINTETVVKHMRTHYSAVIDNVKEELKAFYESPEKEAVQEPKERTKKESTVESLKKEHATPPVDKEKTLEISLPSAIPPQEGRGGQQHRYLQNLIRKTAQDRGLRAEIEYAVDGGFVDVAIFGAKERMACEVCGKYHKL